MKQISKIFSKKMALAGVAAVLFGSYFLAGWPSNRDAALSGNHVYQALRAANEKMPSMRGGTLDITPEFRSAVHGDNFNEIVRYFQEIDSRLYANEALSFGEGKPRYIGLSFDAISDLALPNFHQHVLIFRRDFELWATIEYQSDSEFEVSKAVIVDTTTYP